ncbi:hypothetical protein Shyhy01_22720 [Streptomyces hygroscopicus subsp. hygroscopicus]|nr:hypothetical protein Shyhy01_22720 [Streptomyces hygroscopicus subsp. hygroscopicus]
MTDDAGRVLIRRAGAADIDRPVEFRALMMSEMGEDVDAGPTWRGDAAAWFARRMEEPDALAAFVAECPVPAWSAAPSAPSTITPRVRATAAAGAARSPMSSRHRTSAVAGSPAPA